ncbi:hypothetical protein [Pedobacter nyackensis]|uniref:Uncharacterized protein n=1 Tax=Pedobacter nyackensis TaxID=475255 RepID=A0A1W2AIH7_9SPHI|nr:hypothetical protein [Pedobacter nyackensis]SMC60505.1 hypothetical protein SAMN04488101_101648 [Pedobacter nyackensis]
MNSLIFRMVPFVKSSFLQSVFKQQPGDNAIIEVNNLLASRDIMDIQKQDIKNIEEKYGLSLQSEYDLNLQEFYAVYWNYYIKMNDFSLISMNKIEYLANLFDLSEDITSFLKIKVGEGWYRRSVERFVSGRRLKSDDWLSLERLTNNLQLPDNFANAIIKEEQVKVMESYMASLTSKNRCSPEEAQEMENMLDSFRISIEEKKTIFKKIKILITYWETEKLPLSVLNLVEPAIQKSEVCYYFESKVKWYETRNSRYGGKDMELIQMGELYLTNKRLLFVGHIKTSQLPFNRIVRVARNLNEITINKDKGKNPTLCLSKDAEVFRIIINRLMLDRPNT